MKSIYCDDFVRKNVNWLENINRILSKSFNEKLNDIKNNKNLDVFIRDKDIEIRKAVARSNDNKANKFLSYDYYEDVRLEVAKNGYCLDKLIYDPNYKVYNFANKKIKEMLEKIEKFRNKTENVDKYTLLKEYKKNYPELCLYKNCNN